MRKRQATIEESKNEKEERKNENNIKKGKNDNS
jgi:hypothetical protein